MTFAALDVANVYHALMPVRDISAQTACHTIAKLTPATANDLGSMPTDSLLFV